MHTVTNLIPIAIGAYEALVRAIPTKKNHSLLHGILNVLLVVSNFLNNKSK